MTSAKVSVRDTIRACPAFGSARLEDVRSVDVWGDAGRVVDLLRERRKGRTSTTRLLPLWPGSLWPHAGRDHTERNSSLWITIRAIQRQTARPAMERTECFTVTSPSANHSDHRGRAL